MPKIKVKNIFKYPAISKVYIVTRTVDNGKHPQSIACLTRDSVTDYIEDSRKKDIKGRDIDYKIEDFYIYSKDMHFIK
jgi:hypothetical protein